MMRAFLTAVAVSVLGFSAPAAQAETLADALASAYKNSKLLDQNEALLRAADEDVAQAVARLRPVINFVAQAQNTDTNPDRATDGLQKTMTLALQWTLLDFGRNRLGVEIAKETVLATREALKDLEAQVLLSAVSAYVDVRLQAEIVSLRQSNVRLIGQELKAAQDRFDVGEVTRTDVAIAEARLAAARSGLAAAEGDFKVARERYKAVVGDYPGNLAGLPPLPKTARSMEEARMIALRTHPDILAAQRQVTISELGVEATKAAMRPTVTFEGGITEDIGNDARRDTASLSFNQTLYAGGALSSAHRAALAQKEAAQAGLLQTTITVGETVGNAWAALEVAGASIQAGTLQVQAAQTAFDGVREEATLGARTTLDVLNAEQELLDARATKLQAEAQRYIGVYSLLSAMGLLSVEHLNLGVPTYDPALYYNAVKTAPITSPQGKKLQRILDKIGD
ncbi:TolC family outer membrane protein [Rhodobacteraceae bacterium HSP-20]|uniref:TolC family outer membrane protein n=1 Tax=Paragemmobacter amnigenus TaxID=2852097 RepID=A0ABS6IYA4_9RHOB|nr:TolC family outer membrane protein [Rhodobacter amnigenus]MBU9696489.1 TolC family outer membrane protein [Rhodobacter amnigenus]MBV4387716.1 TolC family outer membrane protein [Rhodobacter amnigenus]